ncbi:hypothetical Protein YC6258_00985 [Gynuella sunshinyii YC6258]|uniref:Uncharacterized protein n=1 Tax=Gynuella sunshinyii YC6258 TaxID=1445510 RepID=A0A0C5V0E1_9GAMM|nr:hypothetical Protein YC6258_00985 [Gynuella sunshinyii YC6258]
MFPSVWKKYSKATLKNGLFSRRTLSAPSEGGIPSQPHLRQ